MVGAKIGRCVYGVPALWQVTCRGSSVCVWHTSFMPGYVLWLVGVCMAYQLYGRLRAVVGRCVYGISALWQVTFTPHVFTPNIS